MEEDIIFLWGPVLSNLPEPCDGQSNWVIHRAIEYLIQLMCKVCLQSEQCSWASHCHPGLEGGSSYPKIHIHKYM